MMLVFFRDEDYAYNEPSCGYKQSFGYQKRDQDLVWHLGQGRGCWGGSTRAGKLEISGYEDLVKNVSISIHRIWS